MPMNLFVTLNVCLSQMIQLMDKIMIDKNNKIE